MDSRRAPQLVNNCNTDESILNGSTSMILNIAAFGCVLDRVIINCKDE